MKPYKIFIVEDDAWYGEILKYHLSLNDDYDVSLISNGHECLSRLSEKPDLITLDLSLPDMHGEEIFKKIREKYPTIPVVVISGQEDIGVAVNLLKMGVTDYLIKDEATKDLLWDSVVRIRKSKIGKVKDKEERVTTKETIPFGSTIIGESTPIKSVFDLMDKAASSFINVAITGETGTGKEVVAQAIHYNSVRKNKNFVAVNMAAIPDELIESDLFGHEKGSFTGAANKKIGKFEQANGGTLFLDEVAELDLNLQSKLLRVLQERELTRVGGNEIIKLDVRLIIATHKNLLEEVKKGNFREDLYYRIMGLTIELPPLRDRGDDILLLSEYFISQYVSENSLESLDLSSDAKSKLLGHHYPGNVRELKSIIELAAVMSSGGKIEGSNIQIHAISKNDVQFQANKTLREHTCDIVRHYLDKYGNNVVEAAEALDIGKSTIYKMMKEGELEQAI